MTTYTHDGITVTRSEDGRLYFHEGIRSTFLAADEAAAIHAAYLHSLGLTLWEHDGEHWLIPLEGRSSRGGRYILRLSDHSPMWADPSTPADPFDRALAAYLAAQTPPEPPQPGERWLLDGPDGPIPATVVEHEGQVAFVWTTHGDLHLRRVERFKAATYRRAES